MDDLRLPLTQSQEFERACNAIGLSVHRVTTAAGTCLIQSRRLPLFGRFNLISRGPVLRAAGGLSGLWSEVRQTVRGPVAINAPAGEAKMPGFKLVRGAELALIDIRDPGEMRGALHQKWRNQLKKAEQSPLTIVNQPLDEDCHAWFFSAEQAQQASRRYTSYPASLLLAYAAANKGQARLYTAMQGTRPVAAMLILKHGAMATYQAGVTTDAGRLHCAHNLILWTVMTDLHRCKVSQLDLGRADLSDGLRRFKRGAGARLETLAGTSLALPPLSHMFAGPKPNAGQSGEIARYSG